MPCHPIFRRLNELFTEWGGRSISTYLWFAAADEPGSNMTSRPLESLAEGVLINVARYGCMFFKMRLITSSLTVWTVWLTRSKLPDD